MIVHVIERNKLEIFQVSRVDKTDFSVEIITNNVGGVISCGSTGFIGTDELGGVEISDYNTLLAYFASFTYRRCQAHRERLDYASVSVDSKVPLVITIN